MIEITTKCTFYLLRKTGRSIFVGNLFLVAIIFFFAFSLPSCEGRVADESDSLITAVGELTRSSVKEKESFDNNSAIVFTGNDIQWFNPTTREIKFKKNIDYSSFQTYQKIHFKLNNNYLFTAQTYVSQYHSFTVKDLVLYIDISTRKCYLHDCYPLDIAKNDPDTQNNKEKRASGWNSFVSQLQKESKIK